jgi:hypothetical protein
MAKLAKTGHGPYSSKLVVICVVLLLFVMFYVLFVCKCVLYYCHRVTTQLQLTNISYRTTSSHPDDLCCVTVWAYVTASKAVSFGSPNSTLNTLRIFGIKNVVTHTLPVSPHSPAASSSLPTLSIPVYPTASGARAKCLSDNECRMDIISKLPHYPYLSMCDTLNKQTITIVHCHCSVQIYLLSHPVNKSIRVTF